MKLVNILKILVQIIYSPSIRKLAKEDWHIRKEGRAEYYTRLARSSAASCGRDLRVNNPSIFGGKIHFGDNCNFNGISVLGGGVR